MGKTVCTRSWILLPALVVVGLLAGTWISAPAAIAGPALQGGTTVAITPAQAKLACGQTGNVDIQINNVTDLFGVDVKVSFDPNILEVVDANPAQAGVQIQAGNLPDVSGGQGLVQQNLVDNTTGTVSYAAVRLSPAPPQSGSGVIASITFRGKSAGTSPVNITSLTLSDETARPIQAVPSNGEVEVNCDVSPTPTRPTGPTPTATATRPGGATATPTKQAPPGNTCTYIVKKGDTLYSIARQFGTTPAAIAAANNLANPNLIYVGQPLTIPNCKQPGTPIPPGTVVPPPTNCFKYTVRPGDTLYRIAATYGDTVTGLAFRNGIANPNLIFIGQVITVCPGGSKPTRPPCRTIYIVKPGDTLSRIALVTGSSVQAIAAANNLANPNLIYPGQQLCIP
jgi:LysM repeat protein